MTDTTRPTRRGSHGRARRLATPVLVLGTLLLGGCHMHGWFDQSVIGRWEVTPTTAPILDRIEAIEGPDDEFVQFSEVTPDDLVPRPREYRVGPGDFLQIIVFDLRPGGAPGEFQTVVDTRGMVYLEEIGEVPVSGLTADGIREAVSTAALDFVSRPNVLVRVLERRQSTYTMVGATVAGTYPIPKADWFLMDALAASGWLREGTEEIFIIRQIPLSEVTGQDFGSMDPQGGPSQQPAPSGAELLDDVDRLLEGGASPGAFGVVQDGDGPGSQESLIDLIDDQPARVQPSDDARGLGDQEATWMFLDGQWVRVNPGTRAMAEQRADGGVLTGDLTAGQIVTQRIIRVPAQKLIQGDMRYNVVVEPGDIIRVPARLDGLYFVAGFVNRPGGFALAQRLTLMRAIDQAGGINQLGVPDRIELVRMLDDARQAIIQLNLRAINRGLEPDIYLKPNDRINVGSAIWAYPLAVVRNGFRATYGFGFLLDRNFGNDVFGPPPLDSRF
ncbi:MAG: polysaccharide biosynthesis/export family protein [Phycisphaerales bacterium]